MKNTGLHIGFIAVLLVSSASCLSASKKYPYDEEITRQDLFDYNNISAKAQVQPSKDSPLREPAQISSVSLFEESQEDRILKSAEIYIKNQEWQNAFNELIKYEPVLTYSSEIINKLIYVSIKLEKYSIAEEQIRSILKPQMEWQSQTGLVKLLAQVTYLGQRYEESLEILSYLRKNNSDSKIKSEVEMYFFLIGYKTSNNPMMEFALNEMKMDHEAYVRFSLYHTDYLKSIGKKSEAFKNLEALYQDNKFETEVTLEYVKYLMDENRFKDALKAIQVIGPDVNTIQYQQAQLAMTYIFFKTGQKDKFQNGLKEISAIDKNYLQSLWLGDKSYSAVYEEVYSQHAQAEELILRNVKNKALAGFSNSSTPEIFTKGKINLDGNNSIRLPASLEKHQ